MILTDKPRVNADVVILLLVSACIETVSVIIPNTAMAIIKADWELADLLGIKVLIKLSAQHLSEWAINLAINLMVIGIRLMNVLELIPILKKNGAKLKKEILLGIRG